MAELTRRYIVMQMTTEGPFDLRDPDAPFVLRPWKDPAALKALESYRDHCYPELAAEITAWIEAIGAGPSIRGSVGARNELYLASRALAPPTSGQSAPTRAASGRGTPGRRARTKAKVKPRRARKKRPRRP
jgi:hypothetical protein